MQPCDWFKLGTSAQWALNFILSDMSQLLKTLPCADVAMDFLWARTRKDLEDMAAAMGAIAAVCSDWNTEMFSRSLKFWYCRHLLLWECLIFMNSFTRRKTTLHNPRFVVAEMRSRAINAFKVHTRLGCGKSLDTDRVNLTCSLNCCRSPAGPNIVLSRRLRGNLSEDAYGDSDYDVDYRGFRKDDAGILRQHRHSWNHIPKFLKQLSGWLTRPCRITASIQPSGRYNLHVCWVTHGWQHQQADVAVGQIAVACSKGCYKILKAITKDLADIDGELVLVLRGVSDAVMFPLDNNEID